MEENNMNLEPCEGSMVSEPYCDPIFLECEDLLGVGFDETEFLNGVKDGSYYTGIMSAMISSGMNYEDATNFVFSVLATKQNIEVSKIQSDSTVEASKNAAISIEKQTV